MSLSEVYVVLVNTVDGRTIMLLLSSFASSLFDHLDNVSALVFIVPGMCLSIKSYSDNSWNSQATL